jgi:hypothetical protein
MFSGLVKPLQHFPHGDAEDSCNLEIIQFLDADEQQDPSLIPTELREAALQITLSHPPVEPGGQGLPLHCAAAIARRCRAVICAYLKVVHKRKHPGS